MYMCGTDLQDKTDPIALAISVLAESLGRAPNATEVADHLGSDREEIIGYYLSGGQWAPDRVTVAPRDPELIASTDELQRRLSDRVQIDGLDPLLDTLSEEDRSVVLMRLSEGLTQSTIAERLGLSPCTVSRTLARSLTYLREHV